MGALNNVRVIDFGHYVAGPVAGMLLADQGAEVIKVDPPGGPVFDSPANATWNRGKKSICLDLHRAEDVAIARSLAVSADVVIENFRPGTMARFELDHASLREHNPGLITLSMPGFGATDSRSAKPGWEGVVLAATDVFRPLAEYRNMIQVLHTPPAQRSGDPVYTAEPVASMYAALIGTVAVATALLHRHEHHCGQSIEVPLFDAMLQAVGVFAMSRIPFKPVTSSVFSGFDHQYQCSDGRWVHVVATVPRHGERLLSALGRDDLIARGLAKRGVGGKPELNQLLIRTLTELFMTRPALDWENLFVELGIPGAMCRSTAEWLKHPQATGSDLLADVEDAQLGKMLQPGLLVKLSGTPGQTGAGAPMPDADREETLAHLKGRDGGVAPTATVDEFPLKGVRVLDLCIILAGPTCGRTLAELGADVIKIDDPSRGDVLYHHDINRGKRSILLDLNTEEGMQLFWNLVETADVIVQNFRGGVVENMGIDYEAVAACKPDIIYASLNAFGDTGPWREQPGYEEVAQALCGMQVRFGGAAKPILWPYGVINDYGTGYAGAFGVLMALYVRSQTGDGQHVTSALARTACLLQSTFLQNHDGKCWDEPHGPDALGSSTTQRLYECRDNWVFIGARNSSSVARLIAAADEADLEIELSRWCSTRTVDEVVTGLGGKDIAVQPLSWICDVADDAEVQARGLIVTREHEKLGEMRTTGPGFWFSDSKIHAGRPAPLPGADIESVLADIGRDDLTALLAKGVVKRP